MLEQLFLTPAIRVREHLKLIKGFMIVFSRVSLFNVLVRAPNIKKYKPVIKSFETEL